MEGNKGETTDYIAISFLDDYEPLGRVFDSLKGASFSYGFTSTDPTISRAFAVHSTEAESRFVFLILREQDDSQPKCFTLDVHKSWAELRAKLGMSEDGFDVEAAEFFSNFQDELGLAKPNQEDRADFERLITDFMNAMNSGELTPIN